MRARRDAPRFAFSEPAVGTVKAGFRALIIDLSETGAQLSSPVALAPGRPVRCGLPTAAGELNLDAVVAWCRAARAPDGSGALEFRAGLRFTDLSRHQLDALRLLLVRLSPDATSPERIVAFRITNNVHEAVPARTGRVAS